MTDRPSIAQRLVNVGWQRKTSVGAVGVALLAIGVFVALSAPPPSHAVAPAGIASPLLENDVLADVRAAQASNDENDAALHCFGSAINFFEPGLTVEPTPHKVTGYLNAGTELSPTTPCSSPTGVPYTGFTAIIRGSGEMACTTVRGLVGEATGIWEIIWDNGDESTARWTAVAYGALPVIEATITEGELAGATILQEGVPTSITGSCVADPVTSMGYSGVATFVLP